MGCNKIDRLLMKYFDNTLLSNEKLELDTHLENCTSCREDFLIYNNIIEKFENEEIINTPSGFEENVMKKIDCLGILAGRQNNAFENLLFVAFGCFSLLLGLVFLIFVNQENIMQFVYGSPQLTGFYNSFIYIKDFTIQLTTSVNEIISFVLLGIGQYFEKIRYILIFLLTFFGVAQFILYKRSKIRV